MFFRKPVAPKPIAHWYGDMKSVERLREILDEPVFQMATAILSQLAQPSLSVVVAADDNSLALRHAWLAGYNDALNDLHKLTRLPTPRSDLPGEWEHISNPNNA